jgi:hypothetical protein
MYQHLQIDTLDYTQVFGTGSAGGTFPPPAGYTAPAVIAPGYNGPPITPQERLAVGNTPGSSTLKYDIVTGQADWHFGGQHLAYTGNYGTLIQRSTRLSTCTRSTHTPMSWASRRCSSTSARK